MVKIKRKIRGSSWPGLGGEHHTGKAFPHSQVKRRGAGGCLASMPRERTERGVYAASRGTVPLTTRISTGAGKVKTVKRPEVGTMQLSRGARPPRAQWAAPSRATRHRQLRSLFGAFVRAGVRREGAPNSSRGGCAPHAFRLHCYGVRPHPDALGWGQIRVLGCRSWRHHATRSGDSESRGRPGRRAQD